MTDRDRVPVVRSGDRPGRERLEVAQFQVTVGLSFDRSTLASAETYL